MAAIGLAEAARLTRKNQSTIHRAMASGKLSYTKDAAGEWRIDVAELERVFGLKTLARHDGFGGDGASAGDDAATVQSKITHGGELAALRELIERQDATIADLRASIRSITDEKRALLALLTGSRVPWWRWWFR